jgi:tetratricopeptide (TPR) repeat protein
MFVRLLLQIVFITTLAALISCGGPKERAAMGMMDTPETHYTQGKKLLEKGQLAQARREFNEAISLKANFAPAFEGLAICDIEDKNLESAKKNIDKALDEDGDWIPAKVAKGRWYIAQSKYEDAVDELEDAVGDVDGSKSQFDKKATKMDGYYYMGVAYKEWEKYIEAQTTFQKILEIDNTDMRAKTAIKELAEYQAAVAGQSPLLKKIAKQKSISRADVAALFVTEMPLDKIFKESTVPQQISFQAPSGGVMGKPAEDKSAAETATDVSNDHWAKSFIDHALKTGIIEKFPDNSFRPEETVNRGEFAKLIEHFLVKAWSDQSLETKFFGSQTPYADVLNTAPLFNAIMVVSSRGIMPGFEDGTFKPLQVVSGAESLNIMANLKSQVLIK